jgi:UDP-GlcNAc3NAcA epimerase
MNKVLTVLGARPQFIKASVVSRAIVQSHRLTEVVVHTGQHFDANMSDVFFTDLGMLKPAYHLNIHSGMHGAMTGRMLEEVERVLLAERPDAVLVYGDTNSTLAGALAAVKLHIPVAHVEAGLRSFNLAMPEEVNRILTDRVSRWLFTPTVAAARNLTREGFLGEQILPVGDVMLDAALYHGATITPEGGVLQRLDRKPKDYILVTIHRAENTDHPERLAAIVDALEAIAEDLPVVWPLHPRTRAALQMAGRLDGLTQRVTILDPVGYRDMVQLEKFAALIATDSGGVQREAFFYRVPCVTLRGETEWVELLEAGWNRLAPPNDAESLRATIRDALGTEGKSVTPYGNGNAADTIVGQLIDALDI